MILKSDSLTCSFLFLSDHSLFPLTRLLQSGFEYSGLLTFHYHSGYQLLSENVQVKNTDTVATLIAILLRQFLPQYESVSSNQPEASHGYITISQGGSKLLAREHEWLCVCNYTRSLNPMSMAAYEHLIDEFHTLIYCI